MVVKDDYEYVYDFLLNNNILLLEDKFINKTTNMKMVCLICGDVFSKSLSHFQQGRTCSNCNKEKRKHDIFLSIKFYASKEGYILLSKKFINAHKKLVFMCPKGHIFEMNWSNFKSGKRCKKCSVDKLRLDYKQVKKYIESRGYKLLSKEYNTVREKLKIQCSKGHIFEMTYNNFRQGNRCGKCRNSIGEEEVSIVLDRFNVRYKPHHSFEDCKFYNALPFDFYLSDYNCCIEYDGKQHYKIIEYFGGYDRFVDRKIRDTVKTQYCKKNNIKLIRIPYWEFDNIENILIKELNLNKYE